MRRSTGKKWFAGMCVGGLLAVLATDILSEPGVTPGSKAASMESCVAPTPDIRRNHMDYLKHDRVVTVHQGVRDTKFSLAECVACHAAKDEAGEYKPINDDGQFCESCHGFVAVNLTCFQCHRRIPGESPFTSSSPGATADRSQPGGPGEDWAGHPAGAVMLVKDQFEGRHAVVVETDHD